MVLLLEVLKNDPIRADGIGAGFIKAAAVEIKGRLTVIII